MGAQAVEVSSSRSLATIGVLAAATFGLTLWVAFASAPLPGDRAVLRAVQDLPHLGWVADLVNTIGDWQWAMLVGAFAALTVVRWRRPIAREALGRAGIALPLAIPLLFLDSVVKVAVQSPRPVPARGIRVDMLRESYGFPSGHVYGDVLLFGLLFVFCPLLLPRPAVLPARVVLLALVAAAGPARMVVGAHWPSDVLGGYLWGALALTAVLGLSSWLGGRYARKR